jgi:two-component system response regulator NreC
LRLAPASTIATIRRLSLRRKPPRDKARVDGRQRGHYRQGGRRHKSEGIRDRKGIDTTVTASSPITIVIADDHAVVRQGLRLLLEAEGDLAVVGEASDLRQTLALLREQAPAVLVLDLHMGRELSLATLAELRATSPSTRVVILTMDDDPAFVAPAWNAGAAGYVLKEASRTDLVRAIRTVGAGGRYLDPAIGGLALGAGSDAGLTERELEVLRLLALGYTNAEIAKQMYISPRTVETHRANLQGKLGAAGRPQLVRYALEHGVIHR